MRKLKLDPENLAIESFVTAAAGEAAGTVRGAQHDADTVEAVITDPREPAPISIWTCLTACGQATCGGTCGASCATCFDPTCNSCYATRCWTGMSPECCA